MKIKILFYCLPILKYVAHLGDLSLEFTSFECNLMKQIKSLIKKFCSTSYARMHFLHSSKSEMRCHSTSSAAQLLSRCDSSPHTDLLTPLPPRGLNAAAAVTLWLYLSNLDGPLRSRLLSGVCVLSPLKSYFSAQIWISLCVHPPPHPLLSPPLYVAIMSSLIVRSDHIRTPPCLTSEKPADSVISQISDLVNIINLQLSSHFSPYVLPCLCLFLSLSLSQVYIPCRTAIVLANEEIDYCY